MKNVTSLLPRLLGPSRISPSIFSKRYIASFPTTLRQRTPLLPRNLIPLTHPTTPTSLSPLRLFQRRTIYDEPLKVKRATMNDIIPICIFIGMVVFVVGYDAYYYIYEWDGPPAALSPTEFRKFTVQEIIPITHDTQLIRFTYFQPGGNKVGTVPMPSHVIVKDDTCQIARAYTPINYTDGFFDLLVKRYPEGSVSRFLHGAKVGDRIEIRGPIQSFPYTPNMVEELGMTHWELTQPPYGTYQAQVAAGTGITPMYQLIKRILKDRKDKTKITLVFANKTPDDIPLWNELRTLEAHHAEYFQMYYTVDDTKGEKDWTGGVGFVDQRMLKAYMPDPAKGDKSAVLVCGPEGFVRHVAGGKPNEEEQGPLGGLLKSLGFTERQVFKF
ncbi:hypothetical protein HK097_002341 [Rhizophlyctis rosea]|uniref:FAD-binding FR-type domain-containing protein n=1 Tax=Rhizophlyctis rosea TaxID=64517 RepID=A0AAD5XA17_9FUNG|nr:hypothetical protein HK097_002341 [Rhizophlyctis rosea]